MKIAILSDAFYPRIDGVSITAEAFAVQLAKKGHQILIITAQYPDTKLSDSRFGENINIIRNSSFSVSIYPNTRISWKFPVSDLNKFNPDLIHYHTEIFMGVFAIIYAKIYRKPLVSTFHTYYMKSEYLTNIFKVRYGIELVSKLFRNIFKFIHSQSDIMCVPSDTAKKDFQSWKFPAPITVSPTPIEISTRKKPRSVIQNVKKQWKLKKFVYLYVGRVSKEKSIDVVIKSFEKIKDLPVSLLIVGDGPARTELEKLTHNLNLQSQIIFTGAIPHNELFKKGIYQLADGFVTASTSETLGLTVLEAMAYGIPVIGVDAFGVGEVVGQYGLLSRSGDVDDFSINMQRIFQDKKLRQQLQQKSLTRAKGYSPEVVVNEIEETYLRLLEKK